MPINPLNIEVLEIIDAIERRGSFAKAAEELNKATSALSYGIQKLEEQLDISVFQRQGRRSVLTPAGRLILDEGRKILESTVLLAEKAKELATGWEPKIRIAAESTLELSIFFKVLDDFLAEHEGMEIDVCESVLSGGWEALEHDRVDLLVGAPGPVPLQKGFRAVPIEASELIPVVASHHPLAKLANDPVALKEALPMTRAVVTHDTAMVNVARNAGFSMGKKVVYVQTMEQKIEAQLAGLGMGHIPKFRIQRYLDEGRLVALNLETSVTEIFIAWKISNKGKALQALAQRLGKEKW